MRRISTICMAIFLLTFLNVSYLYAKSYKIIKIEIIATVNLDGSIDIQEFRTYKFKGKFRWADYRKPVKGFDSVVNFELRDEDIIYHSSSGKENGTYQVSNSNDEFYVKWFYGARNESKTFILSYKLTNILNIYPDVAELYYQFVGDEWDHGAREVNVIVKLPYGAALDELRAWAHGPLWGNVTIMDETTVHLDIVDLPRYRFWEGRILFPARLVSQLPLSASTAMLDKIIEEESRWAREANEEKIRAQQDLAARNKRWKTGAIVLSVLAIAAFLIWLPIFNQHGRPYPSKFRGQYYSEIPNDLPPALLGYFVNYRSVTGSAMVATLFDLARRGFLKISEEKVRANSIFGKKEKTEFSIKLDKDHLEEKLGDLQPFENKLIEYLFEELSQDGQSISMKEIAKSRSKTTKWFSKWRKEIADLAKEKGFYDLDSRQKMMKGLIPSLGLILAGLVSIPFTGPGAIIPCVVGLVLFIITVATYRISREYIDQYAQWKALRRYLRRYKFTQTDRSKITPMMDRYLIYGMILGLTSKRIKQLINVVPDKMHSTIFPWYIYHGQYSGDSFGAAFGTAVSSMVTVASSSFSSATGTGGGSSAGGGGVAVGGGGGAG